MLHPSGTPVGRAEAGGKGGLLYRYYYSDHLGSVRTVVSRSGTTLETRDYYPYGLEMPGRVSVTGERAPEGYTGHELDAETAMNYAGARFYMPLLGRWTTTDPHADSYPSWSPYVSFPVLRPLRSRDAALLSEP